MDEGSDLNDVLPVEADESSALTEPLVPVDKLALCEEKIGYKFRDQMLLRSALTHASGAEHRLASNERLEFLGDSILGLVTCEMLFRKYPEFLEGDLTRIKSIVVSRQTCAKISELLGLEEVLILGKGMAASPTVNVRRAVKTWTTRAVPVVPAARADRACAVAVRFRR